jgi:hypothetical protein
MKLWQLAITLIVLIVLREGSGNVLMRLTGLPALANFGGLAIGSFFAGWLAGAISKLGPSRGQLWSFAALGVIAAIGIGFLQGANFLAAAVVFMLLINIPLSYGCLLLGAYVAEPRMKIPPPPPEEDNLGSDREPR